MGDPLFTSKWQSVIRLSCLVRTQWSDPSPRTWGDTVANMTKCLRNLTRATYKQMIDDASGWWHEKASIEAACMRLRLPTTQVICAMKEHGGLAHCSAVTKDALSASIALAAHKVYLTSVRKIVHRCRCVHCGHIFNAFTVPWDHAC